MDADSQPTGAGGPAVRGPRRWSAALLAAVAVSVPACSADEPTTTTTRPPTSEATSSTTTVPATTVPVPADPTRAALAQRLEDELGDADVANQVATDLDQGTLDRLVAAADGDLTGSPALDYEPPTVPLQEVDSIWAFSFGFRIDPDSGLAPVGLTDTPPPMDVVSPGPVNAALARVVADLVDERPVPVVAQWEIARELEELGVQDVISVEPRMAPDGSVVYLSTPAVAEEGLRIARSRGLDMGTGGVVCVEDMAASCVLSMQRIDVPAGVPSGVELPDEYDESSGQLWTRDIVSWIPVDLLGRGYLAG